MNIVIARDDPGRSEVARLIGELDAYSKSLYPPESNHLLDIEEMRMPRMRFCTVSVDGDVVGCGGIWLHDDYAEVKRVYISPKARGRGLARTIMARLENEARAAGMTVARLETGILQPEALGLYRALGYRERGAFGDYPANDPNSVFMEKTLPAAASSMV